MGCGAAWKIEGRLARRAWIVMIEADRPDPAPAVPRLLREVRARHLASSEGRVPRRPLPVAWLEIRTRG